MSASLAGLRIVSFESRRADDMRKLIERFGGQAICAPSMRELPVPDAPGVEAFADALVAGEFDMVILLTGVGARALMDVMEKRHPRGKLLEALNKTAIVSRGPKPTAVLREWRVGVDVEVPAPNTWCDLLTTLDQQAGQLQHRNESAAGFSSCGNSPTDASGAKPLAGLRVAVQEYGEPNPRLVAGLQERGADVTTVTVYGWALPEDVAPLQDGIRAVADGDIEVMLFTSAQQVRNVLYMAREMSLEHAFRDAARKTLIASVGPTCSESLTENGLGVDFEPDGVHMSNLVRGLARCAPMLLDRKRSSHAAGVDVTTYRRVDVVWPESAAATPGKPAWYDSPFMRACRREPVPYTPIWLMRQAGRYQREYRELRSRVSFLELCRTPELAAEVTLMAVDQLNVDAAIIFADILLIVEPMGVGLAFNKGEGPSIARPVREAADVDALKEVPAESLSFVYDAIRLTRRALKPDVPLIGFCGAPFTVASYMIEGGSSRNFVNSKSLMYRNPGAWHALMQRLVKASADYLNAQIAAGAQVVQVFDSWVGCLSEADYRTFVLPHSRDLIAAVTPGTPVIHFGADASHLLPAMREAGGDVIGLDWKIDLDAGWSLIGHDRSVQGNLDPAALFATPAEIERRANHILDAAAGRPGHIFNLGHGILPGTPVEHVQSLVDFVHEHSGR